MRPLCPHPQSWKDQSPTLDDVQMWEMDCLEGARSQGFKSVIVQASMGTGKTVLAAKSAKMMESKNRRMLFLVHLKTLVEQAESTFQHWGIDVQVEQGKRKAHHVFGRPPHVIASKDSLYGSRLEDFVRRTRLDTYDLEVWYDECHLAISGSFLAPARLLQPVFSVGLTGTPMRLDGRPLVGPGAPFELLCCRYDFLTACKHRNLVSPILLECEGSIDLRGIKITRQPQGADYDPVELAARVSEGLGHICKSAQEQIGLRSIKRTLAFLPDIGVCRAAEDVFTRLGLTCRAIYGDMPDRDAVMRSYHEGQLDVMASCQLVDVGFDDPPTDGIVLAAPTKSAVRVLQRAGRGSRLYPGKEAYYAIGYRWETDDEGPQSTLDLLLRGVPDPDVRRRAGDLLRVAGGRPFLEAVEQAELDVMRDRAEMKRRLADLPISVTDRPAEYTVKVHDPLNVAGKVLDPDTVKGLKRCGLEPLDIARQTPESAKQFLFEWHDRTYYLGMATYKQVQALARAGWNPDEVKQLTAKQARVAIFKELRNGNRVKRRA